MPHTWSLGYSKDKSVRSAWGRSVSPSHGLQPQSQVQTDLGSYNATHGAPYGKRAVSLYSGSLSFNGEDSALPPVTGVTGSTHRGFSGRKPEGRPEGSSRTGSRTLTRPFQGWERLHSRLVGMLAGTPSFYRNPVQGHQCHPGSQPMSGRCVCV